MEIKQDKQQIQFTFQQNWTLEQVGDLQKELQEAVQILRTNKKVHQLILNFHAVVVMDTAGLKLFLSFIKACYDLQKGILIHVSSPSLLRIFSHCGLQRLFTLSEITTHEYDE